ncbi:MAG: M3 family metallopeptidase, partial [Myxococcales bacterium]|nr:M3 family metallopeptidase [Myxococcales bacterium]
ELTAAFNRFDDVITEFENRISNHEGLWKRYKRIEGSRSARRLEGEEARAFAERMQDLRREGADLPAAEKARLSEIRLELSELGRTFAQNVSKDEKAFEFFVDDASKLDGLSELYVKRARESAEGVGKPGYRFTIFDGTATEAMSRVHDPAVREALWRAMEPIAKTGETDNYPLAVRILELRREMAQLLGYDDFSDLATETRMVKNGAAAEEFIDALAVRTKEAAQAEFDELRAFRRSVDGIDGFEPWDGAYWSRKFADTRVDSEVLRKYFPLDNVLEGFFRTTEQIYGVKFEELSLPTWHPDVRSFQVVDATGRELGILQLDLYSRPGKRGGAWHHSLNKGAGDEPTMSVIATNFDPPGADGVVPPIRFRQVETVFHEFGHALHGLFSETKLKSHGGTAVARDFVELPSQIMENFAWEDDVLAYLAKHHETGAALPDELLSALKAERTAGAASAQMRQLALSKLDLALHRHYNPAVDGDIAEYAKNLLRPFVSEGSAADPSKILPEFEHIFSGSYASGYYGYKWAEVLDADAYTRFKADGVLSRRVGDDFRRTILSRGGSEDADQLYRDFMGRDPDLTALLRRLGIDASAAH